MKNNHNFFILWVRKTLQETEGSGLKYLCSITVLWQRGGLWREVRGEEERRVPRPPVWRRFEKMEMQTTLWFWTFFSLLCSVTDIGKNVLFSPLFVIVLFLWWSSFHLSFQCFVDLSPFSFVMLFKLDVHITPGTHASEHAGKFF